MVDERTAPPVLPIDEIPVALAVVARDGTVIGGNAALRLLLGSPDDPAGRDLAGALGAPSEVIGRLLRADDPRPVTVAVPHGGGAIELQASAADPNGEGTVVVALRPLGERDEELDQLVLDAHDVLGEGVIVGDGSRIIHVNDATCRLYGYTREELLAMESLFGLFRPDEQERMTRAVAARAERGEPPPTRFETVIVRKGGDELDVELSTTAVVADDRVRTLTIVRDDTDRRRAGAELSRLAFHDTLTGLPNRLLFLDRVERSLARARRNGNLGALLYIDLDGFKAINDTFGHPAGDLVLMTVANRIREHIREQDSGARLGGDEFAVLFDVVVDEAQAGSLAGRLREAIARPIDSNGAVLVVSASIGMQLFGTDEVTAGELLGYADQAMFEAKRDGAARRRRD
jgi:diguanylate cyclase (GGDEF)-like protein/PAS domain S-box-containing protein